MKANYLARIVGIAVVLVGTTLFAQNEIKSIRATDLNPSVWQELQKGQIEKLIVEFREGDELPVTMEAKGDLIVTTQSNPSYVQVRKNFWMEATANDVQMSLDGVHYQPIRNLVTGTLSVSANADSQGGPANAINVLLDAKLK